MLQLMEVYMYVTVDGGLDTCMLQLMEVQMYVAVDGGPDVCYS